MSKKTYKIKSRNIKSGGRVIEATVCPPIEGHTEVVYIEWYGCGYWNKEIFDANKNFLTEGTLEQNGYTLTW